MSCQTRPHISSDVREGLWVGGKSSPRAMMLSYANITRKRVPSISPHHNIHVRFFKDPWRLNSIHTSNIIYSATILFWTCTDRAVKDAKKKKKCCWNSLSRGEKSFLLSQQNRKPKVKTNPLRSMECTQSERTQRGWRCAFVFSHRCCSPPVPIASSSTQCGSVGALAGTFPANSSCTHTVQFPFSLP